jgi:hypothetical protein
MSRCTSFFSSLGRLANSLCCLWQAILEAFLSQLTPTFPHCTRTDTKKCTSEEKYKLLYTLERVKSLNFATDYPGMHLTMYMLCESICSSNTSRRTVDRTLSSPCPAASSSTPLAALCACRTPYTPS